MIAARELYIVNVKACQLVTQRFEMEDVVDKTKVFFDLSMAGVVPVHKGRAIDIAEKELVIGFDGKFFQSLAVFDAELDIAGFGFRQDFFEYLFYTLENRLLFCVALPDVLGAKLVVFRSVAFTARDEVQEFVGVVFHFDRAGMQNDNGRFEAGGEFDGLDCIAFGQFPFSRTIRGKLIQIWSGTGNPHRQRTEIVQTGDFYFSGGDRFDNTREQAEANSVTQFGVLETEVANLMEHGTPIGMAMGVPAGGKRVHEMSLKR